MKGMENMNVKVENTENKNEVKLTFNIEAEKFEEAMKKVYAKTAKYFNIISLSPLGIFAPFAY